MHYYIDGYNMLFRITPFHKELQLERENLLEDLNRKISLLKLDVSIVFDATFQAGGRSRTHLDALEILYTGEGETADEYILDVLSQASHLRQEIVVTSDKILASHVRHLSVKVETVEEFLHWLNRSYANRLRRPEKYIKSKKQKKQPLQALPSPIKAETIAAETIAVQTVSQTKSESVMDYYQRVFETEFQKIVEEEEKHKIEKRPVKKTRKPKNSKKSKDSNDPFQELPSKEGKDAGDMERWLRIFEEGL